MFKITVSPYTQEKLKSRYFDKGETPCGACNLNEHKNCRLRMDGELCSCTCDRAEEMRAEYALEVELAKEAGTPVPSPTDIYKRLRKKKKVLNVVTFA